MAVSEPTAGRVTVALVAALVTLSAFAGPAAAVTTGSVELDRALDNQQRSTDLTFTFTASANETVSADGSQEFQNGNVVFEFESWNDLDSGASGSSSSWDVVNGHQYEVTYEASASSGADEGTYSWTTSVSGSSTSVSETLELDVTLLDPQFGGATSPTEQVIFTDNSQASTGVDIGFDNDGPGVMVPESVSIGSTPSGIDVSVDSLSDRVDPGGSGTASLDVTVDPSVDAGTYTISGTITDNLGNTQSFSAGIEVRKPPVASVENVDAGGVLKGRSKTIDVTVSEAAGFSGIDGLNVNIIGTDQQGTVTVNGAGTVSTSPGGSDTITVEVAANSNAPQHAPLDWQIQLTPTNQYSPTETIDVSGEVFYPPNLESVSGQGARNVFDTPRSQANVQTTETTVSFENSGDLPMEITGVSVSVNSADVTGTVENVPNTVGGLSSGSARVVFRASPNADEGSYPFTVTVNTATAGSQTITRELTIEHVPRLNVGRSELGLGDVTVTNRRTTSVDISEVLEYESVQNVEVVRTSGPDRYLEVVEQPSQLSPGESEPLVFAVSFDTSAELYQAYQWEFEIRGEGVETETVTVSARPTPYSFEDIVANLSAHTDGSGPQAATAQAMISSLETLESRLKKGEEVPEGDLTETISAAETANLLLDSLEAAREARSTNGSDAAQEHVLRAQATINAMSVYAERIEASQVDSSVSNALNTARTATNEQVERQISYYKSQLEGDVTTLRRANANRQLARLAESRGNTERAKRLNKRATQAFETYLSQVQEASANVEEARAIRASIRENATLVLLNQPLVLNPARLDALSAKLERIDASYAAAAETYAAAGATQQAEEIRQERAAASSRLQLTQYGLWGASGLYAIVVLVGLFRTGLNLYAYLRDRRTVQLGAMLQ